MMHDDEKGPSPTYAADVLEARVERWAKRWCEAFMKGWPPLPGFHLERVPHLRPGRLRLVEDTEESS